MVEAENIGVFIVIGVLVLFGLIEVLTGKLKNSKRLSNDWIQEVGSFFALSLLIKPAIVLTVFAIGNALFQEYQNLLINSNTWVILPIYILLDDVLQYWYHRSAHEYSFLWKLHRSHHQAEEMGFFVSYRNAGLYYLIMPNIWWIGIATFLGAGEAVAIALVLKQMVIIGSHSTIKWDKPFYSNTLLKPIIILLERIIVTPAFHHAHHGKSKIDGISEPNGNFGNMFSIWDQVFGSAVYNRAYPEKYGLPVDPKEHWSEAYLYPFVKSNNTKSELSNDYNNEKTATNNAIKIELKKGEKYLWCKCGRSKNQPFCDGSHHGTKFKPELFEAQKDGMVSLCNCKVTKKSPFCDGSHKYL